MTDEHPLLWHNEWSAIDRDLRVDSQLREDAGHRYRLYRVIQGQQEAAGAVALAIRRAAATEVLLVRHIRPIPGVTLWELPRGIAERTDEDMVAAARREFTEETGLPTESGRSLGSVYPDSGLLANEVAVVAVTLSNGPWSTPDGEVLEARWFPVAGLPALVVSGHLRDGISLSALALAATSGALGSMDHLLAAD
ncbi:NUDIX hydrolase [Tessaracoccus sp. MC1865]|uniref:NUDIX hydrolase n=1 Tax=Tessaracoccus sp. MC1865 TaxID=2760310 RepID=UPI001600A815|nr:NUDIX hydrolase [Tessaracoccus sp. MC1865]MBB1482430.1 NUDIX hydrolase [Tessaracoccus sp. MC1865]QTO38113.1 NUDIX hydrolase [Tessaracoccus sp. MC1865]